MKRLLRVLIVEDSEEDAELMLRELSREYELESLRVDTAPAMREALRLPWDVVLSDWRMPRFTATAAFEMLRELRVDVPFIIVSGTIGEETAVQAMRAGVHDFLVKGALGRLVPVIERELREAALRLESRKMQQHLAMSDRLASIGTLAAGVAHEINNPLAALIADLQFERETVESLSAVALPAGASGLAEREAERWRRVSQLIGEASECLRDAQEAAFRIRDTMCDLKLFSRAESDQSAPVDVRRVLDSAARMANSATRHCARVVRQYADVPPVLANEGRLSQVFLNLIVNAAQAIQEGDIARNEIGLIARYEPTLRRVVVEVRDTGVGIPQENLARIFDPFFTTKPVGIGTGLGLSICHRIVSALGGRIGVRSEVGKGTAFTVELPAAAQASVEPPRSAVRAVPVRRGRVLVLDDEPMVGSAVRRALGREHEVAQLTSAQAALQQIESGERFDVILCDLMMPQMTGMELHAQLSRAAPDQAERMVFLSGGAFTSRAHDFLERVPNARIEKPFDSQQLREIVNGVIRTEPARAEQRS